MDRERCLTDECRVTMGASTAALATMGKDPIQMILGCEGRARLGGWSRVLRLASVALLAHLLRLTLLTVVRLWRLANAALWTEMSLFLNWSIFLKQYNFARSRACLVGAEKDEITGGDG